MNKRILVIGSIIVLVVLLTGAGIWWKNLHPAREVVLRKDLPPAPADYQSLNPDPKVEAGLKEDLKVRYQKEFGVSLEKIKQHPDSFQAWIDLGFIKFTFGDYKGAEDAWLYAGKISPNQPRSFMNLGNLYANILHDYARAEWAYQTAIEKDPTYIPAYRDLSTMLWFSVPGRSYDALKLLQQGFGANRDSGLELLALAGTWSEQSGDIKNAIGYYEQYLKFKPDSEPIQKELARLKGKL